MKQINLKSSRQPIFGGLMLVFSITLLCSAIVSLVLLIQGIYLNDADQFRFFAGFGLLSFIFCVLTLKVAEYCFTSPKNVKQ